MAFTTATQKLIDLTWEARDRRDQSVTRAAEDRNRQDVPATAKKASQEHAEVDIKALEAAISRASAAIVRDFRSAAPAPKPAPKPAEPEAPTRPKGRREE